ncbi:MAG: hypothetical protein HKN99_01570 [Winogradskyella sp.]|nr:hypothetical protein [Winogradskyella sp.]
MKHSAQTMIAFYQSLGKLFYAVAASDKSVNKKEITLLNEIVKDQWLDIEDSEDQFKYYSAYQIEIVFDWLYNNEADSETCYSKFEEFALHHSSLFTKKINALILKTATKIAAVFAGVNKSELIILAQLELFLKRKL